MSALHRAVFAGRVAEVQYLLERRNCDPNVRDQNQRTPLIVCSLSDKDDMVQACAVVLLLKGAKICLSDRLGKNALCWACVRNKVQLVQLFLSDYPNRFQFDLRKRDRDGNTALHLAAREGNTEIVDLLFGAMEESELHAVVTERNIRGETPLHLAAKRGNSGVILALISVSSDALLSRRGAVDSRSAPKWAKAAMKMAGAVDVSAGRPLSEHPVRRGAHEKPSHSARIRRPQTVTSTVSKSKPCPTATSTDISTLFKISEMQISSAWRRPAQAPPTTTPSVVGGDDKCKRPRSSRSKINGKGSSRRHSVVSRSRPFRNSVVDDIVEEEPYKQQKQVPLVVVNELTVGNNKDCSSRHDSVDAASEDSVKSSKGLKRSSPFNTTMSYIPESLIQGRNFLTPFGGAGMAFQFASRNSSLQSLASDIPGLLADSTPAFDRSETVPVITRDGCLAVTQMRRSKSEPSLLTASDQQLTPTKLHGTRYGSKRAYNRAKGRPTSRRRGQGKTQVVDLKDKSTVRRPTSRVTPLKTEVSHYRSPHQIGDTIAPSVLPTPTPSCRSSYRRFTRPAAREAEVTSQRRRKDLEDQIRSIQTDIKRLDKRKKGRSYKPLLPEWMTVNQETTVDELVAAVLHDKKPGLRVSQESLDCHSMIQNSPQPTAPGSSRDQHLSRSDPNYQTKERPQLPLKPRLSSDEKETQTSIYRRVPTLRISRPAHAPSYKQSRSIHKQQRIPMEGRSLVDSNQDIGLQPRVDLHDPRPQLHNSPRSSSTAAISMLPNNNKRPEKQHSSCRGTAQCDAATRISRRTFTGTDKLK